MEDFTKDLEKLVKAGIGAVSEGLSKSAEIIDQFAEKGEPLYNQAVDAVNSTTGKVREAVKKTLNSNDMKNLKASLEKLSRDQLSQAAQWIDELVRAAGKEAPAEPEEEASGETEEAPECGGSECECGGAPAEDPCEEQDKPLEQECVKPKADEEQ